MINFFKDILLENFILEKDIKEIKLFKDFVFPKTIQYLFHKNNLPILILEIIEEDRNIEKCLKEKIEIYKYCLENNIKYHIIKKQDIENIKTKYYLLQTQKNEYINSFKNINWKIFKQSLYNYDLSDDIPLSKTAKSKLTTKQIIVIRKDLMNPFTEYVGKMIAQGSHSSLGVILSLMMNGLTLYDEPPTIKEDGSYDLVLNVKIGSDLDKWLRGIFTKVVVCVNSEKELLTIYNQAINKEIPVLLIEDNGLTKFHKQKTLTALALGPYNSFELDKITRNLPLL